MGRPRQSLLAACVAVVCGLSPAIQAGGETPLTGFVVLSQTAKGEQIALARVVIDKANADCPVLEPIDKEGVRAGDKRPMTARRNPDSANHFKVTVCEALYPTNGTQMTVHGGSLRLPPVPAHTSRIVVFGDTGCKPKDQKDCKKNKDWPFPQMADANTTPPPDLLVHMGDYNYRGTPGKIKIQRGKGKPEKVRVYDAGDNTPSVTCLLSGPYFGQNSAGSKTPDSWKAWKDDFFKPAQHLLPAAPWVFARGNHELCSRAGPGWFYFLDPGSDLIEGNQQLRCPSAEARKPLIFRTPYRVDVGGLSVVVLDSANACDQGSLHQHHFNAQFKTIQSLVGDAPDDNTIWLQSHRPLWGLKKPDADTPKTELDPSGQYAIIDRTLQRALAKFPLPNPVHLVVSGHMHRFQTISFDPPDTLPTQLIVGNGGVDLAHNYPPAPFTVSIDAASAVGFGLSEFGYMDITLQGGGAWKGRLLDRKGRPLAICDSSQPSRTGACSPAGE